MAERERWEREMAGVERERDMERRNSALRYQQLQEEKDQLKQEVERLQEKVRLVHLEKEQLNEQVAELIEEQRCRSPVTAVSTLLPVPVALTREVGTMAEANVSSREVSTTMSTLGEERSNREEELLQTVQVNPIKGQIFMCKIKHAGPEHASGGARRPAGPSEGGQYCASKSGDFNPSDKSPI